MIIFRVIQFIDDHPFLELSTKLRPQKPMQFFGYNIVFKVVVNCQRKYPYLQLSLGLIVLASQINIIPT